MFLLTTHMARETLHSERLASTRTAESTQQYLDIREIKNDVVVMRDGTLRSVLLVSSLNFALKSEEEQQAIVQGYVQFLNSFDFPMQIVIQSRKLNIEEYLDRLKKATREQTNELLKAQTDDYIRFISEFIELNEIMSKRFYVVVPYSAVSDKRKGFFRRVKDVFSPTKTITLNQEKFERYHAELQKRVGYVIGGLSSVGLATVQLDTQALIQLYYETYNPDTSEQEKLKDVEELRIEGM